MLQEVLSIGGTIFHLTDDTDELWMKAMNTQVDSGTLTSLNHFFLNLFFLSGWGLERGGSFNAPTWSVSIEVLLYALFFVTCLSARARRARSLLLIAVVGLGVRFVVPNLGRGIFSFFLGGLVYATYVRILARSDWNRFVRPAVAVLCCALAGLVLDLRYHWLCERVNSLSEHLLASGYGASVAKAVSKTPEILVTGFVFPMTILALCLVETVRGSLSSRFSFLGAWSYSAYLLHVPLQVAILLALGAFGVDAAEMNHGFTVPLFFGLLFIGCHLSYNYLERPAQEMLRKGFARHE